MYTSKTRSPWAPFLNKSVKNQPNLIFWYTKSWRNLTLKSYKLTYLAYKFLQHYLAKCKMNFKQYLTVISSNRWFFSEMSEHSHNIHCPKTVKISLASQHCSQYSKCTDRKNHGVCIHHYLISSSTMCCWNAIDLWNRYCCNSGRMRSLLSGHTL